MTQGLVTAPVYQQLNDLLGDLIRRGEFAAGARFLTERRIAERFGVSRATANKALSSLVSSGMLEFKKGLGTFVRDGMLDVDLRLLVSFTARAAAMGKRPSTHVVSFRRVRGRELDPDVATALGASPAEPFAVLERVRLADDRPVILEHRAVRTNLCPGLTAKASTGSLYAFWTRELGLDITDVSQTIRAVSPDADARRRLGISAGDACLLVVATGLVRDGTALWWEHTLYRGDVYEFHNRMGGPRTPARAGGATLELVR